MFNDTGVQEENVVFTTGKKWHSVFIYFINQFLVVCNDTGVQEEEKVVV